mmetsp:Transcript_18800/g.17940  ORF Transcript_18800/g.17940 Transcript_18800/m.17940 type:complete len:172 (+) Transcript_18800:239-754(+)|eukprot:CAMPEP_0170553204 /NCGR_PEP_ID=MMETSP0211-20121228/11009_1 /TAXON_ID=311385 /ORGANISM="Pseudokeronopsis sp., Strain OXSARD2" /LENGTH=171 /DNA_ID=CAMNT_0010861363 /DNA_START=184 /DNA_END=699 /DNA_ORIENTATION=+
MEEIDHQNNMVLMIFRFYLQANEYGFFIRRLKNVAMTKLSLSQVKQTEENFKRSSLLAGPKQEPSVNKRLSDTSKKFSTPQKEMTQYHLKDGRKEGFTSSFDHTLSANKQSNPNADLGLRDRRNSENPRLSISNQIGQTGSHQRLQGSILNDRDQYRLRVQKCTKLQSPRI